MDDGTQKVSGSVKKTSTTILSITERKRGFKISKRSTATHSAGINGRRQDARRENVVLSNIQCGLMRMIPHCARKSIGSVRKSRRGKLTVKNVRGIIPTSSGMFISQRCSESLEFLGNKQKGFERGMTTMRFFNSHSSRYSRDRIPVEKTSLHFSSKACKTMVYGKKVDRLRVHHGNQQRRRSLQQSRSQR